MSLKRERDREREACGHKNSTLKQINEKERMESNKVNKDSLQKYRLIKKSSFCLQKEVKRVLNFITNR